MYNSENTHARALLTKTVEEVDEIVVRFAGDSGDGIQTSGDQIATTSAFMGDDVATLPDYPSEIRAPTGTLFGVSGFQVHFGSTEIFTPGDQADVLVVMNPAALKNNLKTLKPHGVLIVNEDTFVPKELEKAAYAENPLDGSGLGAYQVLRLPITRFTREALKDLPLSPKQVDQCKNFLALGLTYWLFNRDMAKTVAWIENKFKKNADIVEANRRALQTGWNFGETSETFLKRYHIRKTERPRKPGVYRYVTGNSAAALGLLAASRRSGLQLFLGSYPITPATDILHELAKHKGLVNVFQAEDEIAAIGAAIGAAYGGALAVTTTSGPGLSLKSEFINLAVMTELPLVIINVQRAGPSTGLPTKSEQADLLQALYGRHGESPLPVLAAKSPRDCFDTTLEAARIAVKYMTPVIMLSDGYIGNGAEVWRVPRVSELPKFTVPHCTISDDFQPFARDPVTLARPWAVPGSPGCEHRVGGLEKEDVTGRVSYGAENHERMVTLRAAKVAKVADDIPPVRIEGDPHGEIVVVGWGSTYGPIHQAVARLHAEGLPVASIHLRWLNPLPRDLGKHLASFSQILVPENNTGQLWIRLQSEHFTQGEKMSKVQGTPFTTQEIENKIRHMLGVTQ